MNDKITAHPQKEEREKVLKAVSYTHLKEVAEIFEGKLSKNTLLTMQEKIDQAKKATVGQDENSAFSAVHVYRDQAAILEYLTNSDGSFKMCIRDRCRSWGL